MPSCLPHASRFSQTLPRACVAGRGLALTLLVLFGFKGADAATIVWQGSVGSSNIWNNTSNWVGGAIPGSNDTASFDNTANASNLAPSIGSTNTAIRSITFVSGTTNAYDISGTATLTIGSFGVTNSSATAQQFSVGTIALGANQTWSAASTGNLSFSSAVNLGTRTLTLAGASTGVGSISGVISGTGGITKSDSGVWILSGANTYSGATLISAGTLQLGSAGSGINSPLGTVAAGTTVSSGGALDLNGFTLATAEALTISGTGVGSTGALTNSSATAASYSGVVTLGAASSIGGTGNITLSAGLAGNFQLTKSGTDTLTLDGNAGTRTGGAQVTAGTLTLGHTAALGSAAQTVTMNGGTLNLATDASSNAYLTAVTASSTILSNKATAASAGITHTLGTLSLNASTLSVASGSNVSANSAFGLTFGATTLSASGGVFDVANNGTGVGTLTLGALAGNVNFTKQGAGTLVFNSASTRSAGSTTLAAGTLKLGSVSGLGTTGTTLVLAGGTLDLATNTSVNAYNTTVSGNATILSNTLTTGFPAYHTLGTLAIGSQTLSIASGNNLAANSIFAVTFGATTLNGNATFNVANNGTGTGTLLLGALNDGGSADTITKSGAGVLALGTAATSLVNGTAVNITAGTLSSTNATALGSLANVTISSGATFGVGATQTVGALNGTGGTTTLGANTLTIGNATNNLTSSFGGAITGTGGITKAGTGNLTLSGTNTYSGTTLVGGGTVIAQGSAALGAATGVTTVSSGAALSLGGGTVITKSANLSLNGTGVSSSGALSAGGATGQTSEWRGNITLAGSATIKATDNLLVVGEGTTFTNTIGLGANTLTFNASSAPTVTPIYVSPGYLLDPSNIVVNSAISGTGGITKTGVGTVTLMPVAAGGSTFTGNTVVTGGKLILDSQATMPAINSTNIFVGNSASPGAADTVILQMGQLASAPSSNNIVGTYNAGTNASASNLTVYADGLFNMNGGSNGFINLTLQGGHVSGGNATYNPLLTLTGNVTTNAAARTAVIDNGNLAMSANSFTFTTAAGTAPSGVDLQISSIVQSGLAYTGGTSGVALIKAGAGTMVLNGANSYAGITNVNAGILNIQNAGALGQVGSVFGTTDNGTVVATGAQLQLQGGITVGAETLTLNGTGISTTGALRNLSGNNTYNGFVYLATDSRINADSGTTLTIANTNGVNASIMNGTVAGRNITFGGAGNTIINGGIGSNITNVIKADAGTLTLAGTNGYVGATNVTAGAVKLTNSNALAGTGVTVTSGAALMFAQDAGSNNIAVGGVGSTISGTGVSNGGALQNLNGTNSYAGAVTLAANSRIAADAGSSFTLSGNVNGAGFALDAGGAGSTTFSGVISGTGTTFTKNDSGSVTLAGSSANTFTGAVTVNDGTLNLNKTGGGATGNSNITVGNGVGGANTANLRLLQANQISNTSSITVLGDGRFDLNGLNETIGSFAGTGTIDTGSATLITTGNSSFAGSFAGNGVIQVGSAGSLTFTASTSYAGELSLGAGTTLALAGVNFTVGTLRITGNTVLDFGSNAASVLTATNLILENGATLTITNWVDNQDFFYANGTFVGIVGATTTPVTPNVRGVAPQNQITFTGFSNNATVWQSYDRQITPAPEPGTYGAIFLGGCLGLLGWRRFSRRQAA